VTEVIDSRADQRQRIVAVAARLLREEGPTGLTTRGVAEQAGVQAPTIYRLFGDKDGLLEAVAEYTLAAYVSAKADVAQGASASDLDPLTDLQAGWAMQIEFSLANPAVFRLLSEPHRALQSPAVLSGTRVLQARVHRLATTGRLRVSEQRAVSLIHAAGVGVIQALLETPPDQRDVGLADTLFDAVLRQILIDPVEAADPGPVAAAIALRAVTAELEMFSAAERLLLGEWLDRLIQS
jgi:AcrR family transcriptional regulator